MNYANISLYAIRLRRHWAEITQYKLRKHYACYTIITQINLHRITQINYANHYANYAIITQYIYANQITQLPKMSSRRLRKYHFSSRRNFSHYAVSNLLMDPEPHGFFLERIVLSLSKNLKFLWVWIITLN